MRKLAFTMAIAGGLLGSLTTVAVVKAKSISALEQNVPVKELNILINKPQISTGVQSTMIKPPLYAFDIPIFGGPKKVKCFTACARRRGSGACMIRCLEDGMVCPNGDCGD